MALGNASANKKPLRLAGKKYTGKNRIRTVCLKSKLLISDNYPCFVQVFTMIAIALPKK
ncbi:MAG: hypothetical protein GY707_13840 [Desulfobacteraceae bacterium]|nr:hypothetical protein [Desulfobacteraceae bacterium]